MRRAIPIGFIAVGAAVGLLSAIADDWGVQVVMAIIGAIAGTAFGGAVSGLSSAQAGKSFRAHQLAEDLGVAPNDPMDNYWRDKGRPPLVSALEPEHGRHLFDPDKL